MTTTREIAYKLWQIRSIHGVHTTPDQDWYDAERILREEEGHKELTKELEKEKNEKFSTKTSQHKD